MTTPRQFPGLEFVILRWCSCCNPARCLYFLKPSRRRPSRRDPAPAAGTALTLSLFPSLTYLFSFGECCHFAFTYRLYEDDVDHASRGCCFLACLATASAIPFRSFFHQEADNMCPVALSSKLETGDMDKTARTFSTEVTSL